MLAQPPTEFGANGRNDVTKKDRKPPSWWRKTKLGLWGIQWVLTVVGAFQVYTWSREHPTETYIGIGVVAALFIAYMVVRLRKKRSAAGAGAATAAAPRAAAKPASAHSARPAAAEKAPLSEADFERRMRELDAAEESL